MKIRKVNVTEKDEWARMRNTLWPSSIKEHLEDIEKYFSNFEINTVEVFVLTRSGGKLCGFIELNVRNYAEGSSSQKCLMLKEGTSIPNLVAKDTENNR